jgi:hypothetical protein
LSCGSDTSLSFGSGGSGASSKRSSPLSSSEPAPTLASTSSLTLSDFPFDVASPSPHSFSPFDRRWSASSLLTSTPQSPVSGYSTSGFCSPTSPTPQSSLAPHLERERQQLQRERAVRRFGTDLQGVRPCRSLTHPHSDLLRNGNAIFYASPVPEVVCTWSGQLPPRIYRNPTYSCKVFLGGVPWDITEPNLVSTFKPFGNVKVEWPGKDSKHTRHPPKGYVYLTFEMERSVKALLQSSIQGVCGSGEYYYRVSSRRTKNKEVSWFLHSFNLHSIEIVSASTLNY